MPGKRSQTQGFLGGPAAKIPGSQCRGPGPIPGQGTRPHMRQPRSGTGELINIKKKKKPDTNTD